MKYVAIVLLLCGACLARTYNTVFPNTENPLSESGNWTNGLQTGLKWGNVQTTANFAFGTVTTGSSCFAGAGVGSTPGCNDSTAVVSGSWGNNQQACGTVKLGTFSAGHTRNTGFFEIEIRLRTAITANSITGYEFNYSIKNDGTQYAQMVSWAGPLNGFTVIVGNGSVPALATGDTLCATVSGNNFTFTRNGASILSHTDTTFTSGGGPGIGMFNQNGASADNAGFGFSAFTATDGSGGIVVAASCSKTDVQTAINTASAGSTVQVPAGSCTWTSSVTLASKALTIVMAGQGVTNITDGTTTGAFVGQGLTSGNFLNLSGFTLIKSAADPNGMIQLASSGVYSPTVGFRVHHITIVEATSGSRGIETVGIYGLIDHVTFNVTDNSGSDQVISVFGSDDGADGGFTPWTQPLSLGTFNAVYIEDNTFNYGSNLEDCIDAYGGARLVVRHNAFNAAHIGFHGFDSGDRRSMFSAEIYSNVFTNNTANHMRGITLRGGTAVIFSNTYGGSGASWDGNIIQLYRACPSPPFDHSSWQSCNGTNWQLGSTNFATQASRTASTNGGTKFCSGNRDLVCTADATCSAASAGTCSTFLDGSGAGGYACRDQPGRTHGQVLAPLYEWNNTGPASFGAYDGGVSCSPSVGGLSNYMASGRDYFDGVAAPGYTPAVYPDPLQGGGGGGSGPPGQPSNFSIAIN